MRGTVLYGRYDVRFEECEASKIIKPADAIVRISATYICGSDLWPYRGIQPIAQPTDDGALFHLSAKFRLPAIGLPRPAPVCPASINVPF
jgi:threonine dehydrogenase-like Zn-dependent dehydrogenase